MARKYLSWILAIALLGLATGCMVIFPKTADLKTIHVTYRTEFTNTELPGVKDLNRDEPKGLKAGDFKQTFAAIADYRRKYPDQTKELNHLKVLEGMIYLQTKQLGMASLMKEGVKTAGTQLSSSESAPRDSLFAENFEDMVKGWKVINDFETGASAKTEISPLANAAQEIGNRLCGIKKAKKLKTVDGDQGATYLAVTAGIFYIWADHRAAFLCTVEKKTEVCENEYYPATYLDKGRDLIWAFLTPDVQDFVIKQRKAPQDARVQGEPRFIQYYMLLEEKIAQRPEKAKEADPSKDYPKSEVTDACEATSG